MLEACGASGRAPALRAGGGRVCKRGLRKVGFEDKGRSVYTWGEGSTGDHQSENRKGRFIKNSWDPGNEQLSSKPPYMVTMETEILIPNDNPKKESKRRREERHN